MMAQMSIQKPFKKRIEKNKRGAPMAAQAPLRNWRNAQNRCKT